jgi:hypothetical protein
MDDPSPEPRVPRPTQELTALIRKDLAAAQKAEVPHYAVAGEKLWEAKAHFERNSYGLPFGFHASPGFYEWAAKMFKCSQYQVKRWRKYAVEANGGKPFAFHAEVKAPEVKAPEVKAPEAKARHRAPRSESEWQAFFDRVKTARQAAGGISDQERSTQEREARVKEAKLQQALRKQIIDAGYKAVATKLHPDKKGGSTVDMIRLNQLRDAMKKGYI